MKLTDVVCKECLAVNSNPQDKPSLLREIAKIAKRSPTLNNVTEQDLLDGLEKREGLGSTGFGGGIAIPHCRLPNVSQFVVGLISIPNGVDFDALDNEPVNFVAFIIAPSTASDEHIRILSSISRVLAIPGAIPEMLAASSSESLYESFLRHIRDELETNEEIAHNLFHVFVQNEDLFRDILQVFAGTETSTVSVLESENSRVYLQKAPLFAAFWNDNPSNFNRLILALVNKTMTNETIRKIESITGELKKCSGVLVAVQEVLYCAGSLNT